MESRLLRVATPRGSARPFLRPTAAEDGVASDTEAVGRGQGGHVPTPRPLGLVVPLPRRPREDAVAVMVAPGEETGVLVDPAPVDEVAGEVPADVVLRRVRGAGPRAVALGLIRAVPGG